METVDDIYDEIASAAAVETALEGVDISGDTATKFKADVSNGSAVGRFRIIAWLVAWFAWLQRAYWRIYRDDVVDLAKDGQYGTKRWWAMKVLAFQYGSALHFTDKDSYYTDPATPENKIVRHVAVVESAYKVILKVAKGAPGALVPLSSDERHALQDYCDEIKPTVAVEVRSTTPDLVRVNAVVIADAKMGLPNIKANVELAVTRYFQTLDFNGAIRRTSLKLAILDVPGVLDVDIQSLALKVNLAAPWLNINLRAVTYSGYATIHSAHPLSTSITYVSQNV